MLIEQQFDKFGMTHDTLHVSADLHHGFDALLPSWSDISESTWILIEERYATLGDLAEAETVPCEDLCALATRRGWTIPQAKRWLRRYRVGGMGGLAPAFLFWKT